jgi:peroxiredoxin
MQPDARIKSLFVFPAVAVSLVLSAVSIVMALRGEHDALAWWGAAFANLPLPTFLAFLMVRGIARTSEQLPVPMLVSATASLLALWEALIEGVAGWHAPAVAITGTVILGLYISWYSTFGRHAAGRLAVGAKLPQFELANAHGETFRSSQLAGHPVVLVFFRGNWCPFCMAQIGEIVDSYQELQALGARVVMISPQSAARASQLAARFEVPVQFLVDEGNALARELDIAVGHGVPAGLPGGYDTETVLPTVVVANASGTIIFSDETDNYRVRPEPDVFIAILRRAGAIAQ